MNKANDETIKSMLFQRIIAKNQTPKLINIDDATATPKIPVALTLLLTRSRKITETTGVIVSI
jgi:hypothetical protein